MNWIGSEPDAHDSLIDRRKNERTRVRSFNISNKTRYNKWGSVNIDDSRLIYVFFTIFVRIFDARWQNPFQQYV